MKFLTKQEQWFLAAVLGLLLTGLFVKWYRAGHPTGHGEHSRATIQSIQ